MFDVGFWELALISVVALVIIGPERLPAAARTAGAWIGRARKVLRDVKADVARELKAHEIDELDDLKQNVQNVGDTIDRSFNDETAAPAAANTAAKTGADEIKPKSRAPRAAKQPTAKKSAVKQPSAERAAANKARAKSAA